jgi:hypothetical protein
MTHYGVPAIHEAAHAVIAAYLRVPFTYATIIPEKRSGGHVRPKKRRGIRSFSENRRTGAWRWRTDQEIERQFKRQVEHHAVVLLAPRAAFEVLREFPRDAERKEAYSGDEKSLRSISGKKAGAVTIHRKTSWSNKCETGRPIHINITNGDFSAWRASMLQRARKLVALPHVREAIWAVAWELEVHKMSGSEVRAWIVKQVLKSMRERIGTADNKEPDAHMGE